jgi:hypothetical protein
MSGANQQHRSNAMRRGLISGGLMMGYLGYLNGFNSQLLEQANLMDAAKMGVISAAADLFTVQLIGRADFIPQTKLVPVIGITPLGLTEAAIAGAGVGTFYKLIYPATEFSIVNIHGRCSWVAVPAGIDLAAQIAGALLYQVNI